MSNYFLNTLRQTSNIDIKWGLVTDVIFLVLSSVNNGLHIYVFVAGVGCEVQYVGNAELNNVPYISTKVYRAVL